jgi:hypothetical protein
MLDCKWHFRTSLTFYSVFALWVKSGCIGNMKEAKKANQQQTVSATSSWHYMKQSQEPKEKHNAESSRCRLRARNLLPHLRAAHSKDGFSTLSIASIKYMRDLVKSGPRLWFLWG